MFFYFKPNLFGGEDVTNIEPVRFMARIAAFPTQCGGAWMDLGGDLGVGILTAAHCEVECRHSIYRIVDGGKTQWLSRVKSVHEASCWKPEDPQAECDLAFVRPHVRPSPLVLASPAAVPPFPGTAVVMLGWGGGWTSYSPRLQSVTTPIRPTQECAAWLAQNGKTTSVKGKICAGQQGYGVAPGDSGGPLLVGAAVTGVASTHSRSEGFDLFIDVSRSSGQTSSWTPKANCRF